MIFTFVGFSFLGFFFFFGVIGGLEILITLALVGRCGKCEEGKSHIRIFCQKYTTHNSEIFRIKKLTHKICLTESSLIIEATSTAQELLPSGASKSKHFKSPLYYDQSHGCSELLLFTCKERKKKTHRCCIFGTSGDRPCTDKGDHCGLTAHLSATTPV